MEWIFLVASILFIPSIWRSIRTYLTAPHLSSIDVTAQNLPPIPEIAPTIDRLVELGFHRLGELQIYLSPGKPGLIIWLFVNDERTTAAQIVFLNKRVFRAFDSRFGDDSLVTTMQIVAYPNLPTIEEWGYRLHHVMTDVEGTYRHHQMQLAEHSRDHGAPLRLETVDDYQRSNEIYRSHYSRRVLYPMLLRDAVLPLAWIASMLLTYIPSALLMSTNILGIPPLPGFIGIMPWLTIALLLVPALIGMLLLIVSVIPWIRNLQINSQKLL
jgi:hypothetical protein